MKLGVVITGLGVGGAENHHLKVLPKLQKQSEEHALRKRNNKTSQDDEQEKMKLLFLITASHYFSKGFRVFLRYCY